MRILVTGGTGYIGNYTQKKIGPSGIAVGK